MAERLKARDSGAAIAMNGYPRGDEALRQFLVHWPLAAVFVTAAYGGVALARRASPLPAPPANIGPSSIVLTAPVRLGR